MGDHVFICYAREDQDFVLKLAANLKERGVPVWLDEWDIPASADWDRTIDNALYDCAQFLIVLSPAAVASDEVRGELRTTLDEKKPIVPVLYRTCRIPRRLKVIQHVDFTSRGPDDEAALGQVLRALGVGFTPPEPVRPPHRAPPPSRKVSLIGILKAFGAGMALPLALFALANSIVAQPIIALIVAMITAVVASALMVRSGRTGITEMIIGWLTLVVVVVAGFAIWPRTMMVEGRILDTAGTPVGNEEVVLIGVDGVFHIARTDANGHYKITNVPRGRYFVRVGGYEVGGGAWAVLPVRVMYTDLIIPKPTPTFTPPATPTNIPTPTPTPSDTPPSTAADMVRVPAGEFIMGSDEGESDEQPVHTVYLDAFYMDRTEVTNAQFAQFLNEQDNQEEGGVTWLEIGAEDCLITESGGQYQPKSGYSDHPVIEVSWYGARAYCQWVGKRLPTEAEWEKAARGTDGRVYPWGNTFGGTKLNFADKNTSFDWSDPNSDDGYAETAPVGSFPAGASPYGALDMAGNVWEWVADWYDSGYYNQSPERDPSGPDSGISKVLRGGSWYGSHWGARCAFRDRYGPGLRDNLVGFRCAWGSR